MGAKLGAILCGLQRAAVDAGGIGSPSFQALRTLMDSCGHRLDIYGSVGLESTESLRACRRNLCSAEVSAR